MMNYHVLTLFPKMILDGLNTSIIGRAIESGFISLEAVNIRDFADNKHNKVDDYPYGGGAGMVMQAEPVYQACEFLQNKICDNSGEKSRVIYVTPQGSVFNQSMAEEFAKEENLIFLCGHYEGIDERVLDEVVTDYVSIGDYVLTGGELPAMVMIDAISRLVPGVLNNEISAEFESFHDDLLEYPQYSRPEVWHGKQVPPVLLSGNHTFIEEWRREHSILRTKKRRPDLYAIFQSKQEKNLKRKKKIKAVIFDMDGCLVDSERVYRECWRKIFTEEGIVLTEEDQLEWLGKGREWTLNKVDTYSGSREKTMKWHQKWTVYKNKAIEDGKMCLMPYARDFLDMLKESGLKIAIASSNHEEQVRQILIANNISDFFDTIVTGTQVQVLKPAPDVYLKVIENLGIKRTEAIAFEDSSTGVYAAKTAGIRVVYVPNDEKSIEQKDLPYYRKISDFSEGMAIVRQMI